MGSLGVTFKKSIQTLSFLLAFILLASLTGSCAGSGSTSGSSGGATTPASEISSWTFVDGNGANGINRDTTKGAFQVQLTTFNSKLYAIWDEDKGGSVYQTRVGVYNGNDSSGAWTLVDGGGANGINKNPANPVTSPQLTEFNSKLYATWYELNGGVNQLRVAVYNSDDVSPTWTFVDGNGANGMNRNTGMMAYDSQLTVFNSKLYIVWEEKNGGIQQIRVSVYNGNDGAPTWTSVDGNAATGLNKDTTKIAQFPQTTVFNSKLYLTWYEPGAVQNQIRVMVYNGNDGAPAWTFVDGNAATGLNKNTTKNAINPQLTAFNSKLYLIWNETNGSNTQIRSAVYNGNDGSPSWTFIDGNGTTGLNKDTARNADYPQLTVFNSKLYATWQEASGAVTQTRMAVYNGNDSSPTWTFIDGNGGNGINKNPSYNAYCPQLTVFNSKLYGAWQEANSGGLHQIRVAVGQ